MAHFEIVDGISRNRRSKRKRNRMRKRKRRWKRKPKRKSKGKSLGESLKVAPYYVQSTSDKALCK
jgi:hypothetical protein